MSYLNNMANQVAAEIRNLSVSQTAPFVQARLEINYEYENQPHAAWLKMYRGVKPETSDTLYSVDKAAAVVELSISNRLSENKRFIAALDKRLPLEWPYLSRQTNFGFNRPGAHDVSALFAFNDLLTALHDLKK